MKTIASSTSQSRATVELALPLDARTDSDSDVAGLVAVLLDQIASTHPRASHGDILQALSITARVRSAMAEAECHLGSGLSLELLDISVDAAAPAVYDA
jgi:hypothetical protein